MVVKQITLTGFLMGSLLLVGPDGGGPRQVHAQAADDRVRELIEQASLRLGQVDPNAQRFDLTVDDAVARAMQIVDTFPAEGSSSLQRDIVAGVPSELEAWTGAAVRLGATVGIATPVHSFVHAVLLPSETAARG